MSVHDHWHPILLSSQLKKNAVAGVRLDALNIVLYRNSKGEVGALEDCCPHRRMKLSLGCVHQDKLQCRYHGWTFDAAGNGESPATPKLYASVREFEVAEQFGTIWVRNAGATTELPKFAVEGFYNVCNLMHRVKAPLELTLDNFCEIEHTATAHDLLGYPLERMHEVQVEFEPTDTSVRVINKGPSKKIPWYYRALLGIGSNYLFMDDWTTYFSPVYSIYDHWWQNPVTGRESMVRWRLYIFFVPYDRCETGIFTFAFTKSRFPGPNGSVSPFKWLLRSHVNKEVNLDVQILEGLADMSTGIEGMKLSRFDRVLGLNRERIETIYRGSAVRHNGCQEAGQAVAASLEQNNGTP
jgi:nitrite reductase/ring-hydroxylating ferredoxin subunit